MSRQLSQEELKEAEECFTVFSKDQKLAVSELGLAVRSLGFNPSNSEVNKIIVEFGSPTTINYETFKKILTKGFPEPDTAEAIREAFGVFDDEGKGTLDMKLLRHILTSTGEKLTDEEIDLMMKDVIVDENGCIQYEQLVESMAR